MIHRLTLNHTFQYECYVTCNLWFVIKHQNIRIRSYLRSISFSFVFSYNDNIDIQIPDDRSTVLCGLLYLLCAFRLLSFLCGFWVRFFDVHFMKSKIEGYVSNPTKLVMKLNSCIGALVTPVRIWARGTCIL